MKKKYSIILLVMILVFPFSLFACQRTGQNGLLLDVRYYDTGFSSENIKEGNASYIIFSSNNTGIYRYCNNNDSWKSFTVNFRYNSLDDETVMVMYKMSSKIYDEGLDVSSATAVVHAIFMVSRYHIVTVSKSDTFASYFDSEQYLAQNGFLD